MVVQMNKAFLLFLLTLMFVSCNKRISELEISQKPGLVLDNTNKSSVHVSDQTKSLIIIKPEDSLQIYVRADGAPGMFLDDDGILKGFYVDLEKKIMKEMGQKYKLNSYTDLGPAIVGIKSGDVHSALSVPDVPDYRELTNISKTYEKLDYVIFYAADRTPHNVSNKKEAIETLYGKKVGVQTRGHIYQLLRDNKNIELVEYPTTTIALKALANGEVDAVPEVKRVGLYNKKLNNWDISYNDLPIFSLNIGTGFSKCLDPSIVERYNTALQSLIDSGEVENLYKLYFGQ